jgi:nucleotide-binding universal stress UspA family protein
MNTVAAEKRISIKNILYATDFSPSALLALPYIRGLAGQYGSTVHVLHVRPSSTYAFVTPDMVPRVMETEEQLVREETVRLHMMFGKLPHDVLIETGDLWNIMNDAIAEKSIDLVVIGTSGRTGASKVLLGSVAARILRHAPCPVLTVGPQCTGSAKEHLEMKEILYATDFSLESAAAAPYAISLAQEHQANLTLLNVFPESTAAELVHPEQYVDSTWRLLRSTVPPEANLWCTPKCIVRSGLIVDTILKVADERKPDLIVLGAKEVPVSMALASHFSHATAQEVVSKAPCPVLTVRRFTEQEWSRRPINKVAGSQATI